MEELKINQFLLSMEDIQKIIDRASNGDKLEVKEMEYNEMNVPYLEIQKNGVTWETYLFGNEEEIE